MVNNLPDSKKGNRLIERIKRFVRTGAIADNDAYHSYISAFGQERRGALYSDRLRAAVRLEGPKETFDNYFDAARVPDVVNRALYNDIMMYLPGDLLMLTDRMSMQSSIEARAPFIDYTLMEFMATVPPELKLKGFEKKHILKKAFEGILPKDILYRRKQGFTVPLTVWFRNELNPFIQEMLSKERIERTGLFQWSSVERLLNEHMQHKENHHSRIWALLMFMVWQDMYRPNYSV